MFDQFAEKYSFDDFICPSCEDLLTPALLAKHLPGTRLAEKDQPRARIAHAEDDLVAADVQAAALAVAAAALSLAAAAPLAALAADGPGWRRRRGRSDAPLRGVGSSAGVLCALTSLGSRRN